MDSSTISLDKYDVADLPQGKSLVRASFLTLRDGSDLSIPIAAIRGERSGPQVCLVAAQHGDEWNGTHLCHELFEKIDPKDVNGSIIFIPVANPPAFVEKNRVGRLDNVDMNRVYQFQKGFRPTEQLARTLFDRIMVKSVAVVDLHTGGPGEYLPHVGCLETRRELAESLGLEYMILKAVESEGDLVRHSGSLGPACERNGVAALTVEMGRARAVQREISLKVGRGLLGMLEKLGVLNVGVAPSRPVSASVALSGKVPIKAGTGGVFTTAVDLGQQVAMGDEIGVVSEIMTGHKQSAVASNDGVILYLRREEMVSEGESLCHIAW